LQVRLELALRVAVLKLNMIILVFQMKDVLDPGESKKMLAIQQNTVQKNTFYFEAYSGEKINVLFIFKTTKNPTSMAGRHISFMHRCLTCLVL
jgi:hypothetical protein